MYSAESLAGAIALTISRATGIIDGCKYTQAVVGRTRKRKMSIIQRCQWQIISSLYRNLHPNHPNPVVPSWYIWHPWWRKRYNEGRRPGSRNFPVTPPWGVVRERYSEEGKLRFNTSDVLSFPSKSCVSIDMMFGIEECRKGIPFSTSTYKKPRRYVLPPSTWSSALHLLPSYLRYTETFIFIAPNSIHHRSSIHHVSRFVAF